MAPSTAIFKFLLAKIPVIFKAALFHVLSLSPTSHKWTLTTAVTVTMLREFLANGPPSTITQQQAMFLTDGGVKGPMWVSKTAFAAPADCGARNLRDLLLKAIRDLGTGREEYAKPNVEDVEGEWVGFRAGAKANTPSPTGLSEREMYENLVKDMKTDVTLLYFHGGSYYLLDPVTTRPLMAKYATLSGGRVFSVRYRLAPQNPFPSALLDALIAYLSLLYPPPGSFHEPIPASRIVVGGDSAGGGLASAFLQTLLQLHRDVPAGEIPTVTFHGAEVPLPLPAGVTLSSPSMDLTRCMQESEAHAMWDYLPGPSFSPTGSPPCAAWPSDPPRAELFCEASALCHPLVSPVAAPSWAGSPPVYVVCGEERLTDEDKAFVRKAAGNGVTVVWEQYEAMPHCFPQVFVGSPESNACFATWSEFVRLVVYRPGEMATRGEFIAAKTLERRSVDLGNLLDMTEEDIREGMQRGRQRIEDRFNKHTASAPPTIAP